MFLHVPLFFIVLYAFSSEDKSFVFPPPGLTTRWFAVAWSRPDIWEAITLSLQVAAVSTALVVVRVVPLPSLRPKPEVPRRGRG